MYPAVVVGNATKGHSQAHASSMSRGLGGEEGVKHVRLDSRGHAAAIVTNVDAEEILWFGLAVWAEIPFGQFVADGLGANGDSAGLWRVGESVSAVNQEVKDDLCEL